MKNFEIGIIGGTGGIGKWFADFFKREGYAVHVSGRNTGMDIPTMAEKCEVVIVSVPIGVTCEVIEQVGPHMREGTLLMDLTSLKEEPVKSMLKHSVSEVIGVHPLFGPGVDTLAGLNVVLCPVRTKRWLVWLKEVLEGNSANVVESTPEKHDKMMAIVQGLNHLNTITLGMVLNETGTDLLELKDFATPIFNTKISILERVFGDNPRLYAEIITSNPNINNILDIYEKILSELKGLIEEKDSKGLIEMIKERTCAGL
ncbi:MAG: prephenate dehydrogenase/arogenate dehydrogenase family protein [Syntrophales bacterium]|nr:prephenate dehydrogenase/arogenate dehydrogenase family protein [Syntrophales bacterium]